MYLIRSNTARAAADTFCTARRPAFSLGIAARISVLKKIFIFMVLASVVAACSRAPELVGIDNPLSPVAQTEQATKRTVFIATTRQATEVIGAFYSAERAPELGLASVVVSIPPTHVPGKLERAKRLPPDPRTEFAVIEPITYPTDQSFISTINRELAQLPPKDRKILFFVHGYNNTISDSILRIAQFAEDTEFAGVTVLFSWASAAKTTQYVYDINSALTARPLLLAATDIMRRTNATGFDLFAHSMGAFLTVEAIVQAQLAGEFNKSGRLENIMLAAPDIDLDLFKSQLLRLPAKDRNFVVFVSKDDKALGFSRRISGGVVKVGAADAAELEKLGVTVIDLSNIDDSTSGSHSKFAGSADVVQLIGKGLKSDNYQSGQNQPTLIEVLGGVPILSALVD